MLSFKEDERVGGFQTEFNEYAVKVLSDNEWFLLNQNLTLCISHSASGVLKGFDPLLNLVLDGTIEYMRGKCCLVVLLFIPQARETEHVIVIIS